MAKKIVDAFDGETPDIKRLPAEYLPLIIFPLGRGTRGKTMLARWLAERAWNAGRALTIADADRTNASLSGYFGKVESPPSADDKSVMEWLEEMLDTHIDAQKSIVIDFGGGDLTVKRASLELDLVEMLSREPVRLVAIHLIGPDPDDLAYLATVEKDKLFAPEATILIFNEYCVPISMSTQDAFTQTVRNHEIVKSTLERGAKLVVMPTLPVAHQLDLRRIGFLAAVAGETGQGHPPLSRFARQRVAIWLRDMEDAFANVQQWLP